MGNTNYKIHNLFLNITWTFFLSLALVETLIYHIGLNNLQYANINYSEFYKLILEPNCLIIRFINWTDFLIIFSFMFIGSLYASLLEITPESEHNDWMSGLTTLFDALVILFFIRFGLGDHIGESEAVITILGTLAIFMLRKFAKPKIGSRKFYITISVIISILILLYYYSHRYPGFPTLSKGDPGYIKDLCSLMVLFIIASLLYPYIDTMLKHENKFPISVTILMIIALFSVLALYSELDFPKSEAGSSYIQELLRNSNISSEPQNIDKLRNTMNAHVLIRTVIFLLLGVVAPYVIYVISMLLSDMKNNSKINLD